MELTPITQYAPIALLIAYALVSAKFVTAAVEYLKDIAGDWGLESSRRVKRVASFAIALLFSGLAYGLGLLNAEALVAYAWWIKVLAFGVILGVVSSGEYAKDKAIATAAGTASGVAAASIAANPQGVDHA